MNPVDELAGLLQQAADSLGDDANVDAAGIRRRARRRRRTRLLTASAAVAAAAGLVAAAILPGDTQEDRERVVAGPAAEETARPALAQGWTRLPDSPLTPRSSATAAWTGEVVIVVGGWDFQCPPNAYCVRPENEPPYADGAAYDPETRTWRSIASAPVPFRDERAAVVDGNVYVLVDEAGLLRYRPVADTWDTLAPPPSGERYSLEPAGEDLLAYSTLDQPDEQPDWRFDIASATWRAPAR